MNQNNLCTSLCTSHCVTRVRHIFSDVFCSQHLKYCCCYSPTVISLLLSQQSWDIFFRNANAGAPPGSAYQSPPPVGVSLSGLSQAQALVGAQPNVEKLVEDHLAVQSLIRAYQVWRLKCSPRRLEERTLLLLFSHHLIVVLIIIPVFIVPFKSLGSIRFFF